MALFRCGAAGNLVKISDFTGIGSVTMTGLTIGKKYYATIIGNSAALDYTPNVTDYTLVSKITSAYSATNDAGSSLIEFVAENTSVTFTPSDPSTSTWNFGGALFDIE